ncbi:helix-turn-helix transcriptional regulator [Micromonospora sp. WMMD710]|uniref:helix-turn-helix domain-containing protein n=1 Tax=Micromonospora sp. WMMD710 TaxID=3016085 RepID=UPI003241F359
MPATPAPQPTSPSTECRQTCGYKPGQTGRGGGLTQARISQIESGGHTSLETLRAYVTGLGGHLEVVAGIGNIPLNVA